MPARKSMVLITVDCLRADHCGFMGYSRRTTPFLDQLAAQCFVFPTAIVAGVPTYYSVPAILASRYPLEFGRELVGLVAGEQNLASAFKQAGYATAFFGAANPYVSARFGYDFGFDTFRNFLDDNPTTTSAPITTVSNETGWTRGLNRVLDHVSHKLGPLGGAYDELYFQYCQRWAAPAPESLDSLRRFPAADVIVDQAAAWLSSIGEVPFFLWLHLMDPHAPYYPAEAGQKLLGENRTTAAQARYSNASWNRSDLGLRRLRHYRDGIVSLYDSAVCWVDAQIARFVEILRRTELWKNCMFALTADHGEEFLEHNGRYHAPSSLAEELIQVPLLLRVPGVERRELCQSPFSLLHLAPTLLDAADLPIPGGFQGRSHWTEMREGKTWSGAAIAESISGCTNPFRPELRRGHRIVAVRETRYKAVLNFATSTEHFFDLEADPGEQAPWPNDVAKPERRRLLETALEHLRKSPRRASEGYLRTRLRDIALNFPQTAHRTKTTPKARASLETEKAE
ncbi:MAG: sulfatase [Candidatus Sulfotelmatobacter sp.]